MLMSKASALVRIFGSGASDAQIWAWIDYAIDWNVEVAEILVGAHLPLRGFAGCHRGIAITVSLALWPDDEVRIILREG